MGTILMRLPGLCTIWALAALLVLITDRTVAGDHPDSESLPCSWQFNHATLRCPKSADDPQGIKYLEYDHHCCRDWHKDLFRSPVPHHVYNITLTLFLW